MAKSKPAFISKLGDVLEEADESGYWVELLVDAGKTEQQTAAPLLSEARELVAIVVSSFIHKYGEAEVRIRRTRSVVLKN